MDNRGDNTSDDGDYEVSAEMLIHEDIDDERTLEEEEERMEEEGEEEDTETELLDLQKESELPLDQILASYGYSHPPPPAPQGDVTSLSSHKQSSGNKPPLLINIHEVGGDSAKPSSKPPPPELIHVPPELPTPVRPNFEASPGQQGVAKEVTISSREGGRKEEDVPPSIVVTEDKLVSGTGRTGSKSPWFRPGANPEALARLRPVPERRSIRMGGGKGDTSAVDNAFKVWLGSDVNPNEEDDDSSNDDSDEDYYISSNDWKKYIMVGPDFQASIPSTLLPLPSKRENCGQLLWNPSKLDGRSVSTYLSSVSELIHSREGLPGTPVERDNEDALHLLVKSNYDLSKGLERFREGAFDCKGMSPWTEEECRKFETALRTIGKDFFQLQKHVPTRSVKEVVEFYYLWKKTERYDIFSAQQQSKNGKKYTLRPGYVSDFMEDFLEPPDSDFPDIHYGTTTMSSEVKKDKSQHSLDDRLRDNIPKTIIAKSS